MVNIRKFRQKENRLHEQQDREARLERAFKSFGKGIAPGVASPFQLSPLQQIKLLEIYIDNLDECADELSARYGNIGHSNDSRLKNEREEALRHIISLKVDLFKPRLV